MMTDNDLQYNMENAPLPCVFISNRWEDYRADPIEVWQSLSMPAKWLWWELVSLRNEKNNIAKLIPKTIKEQQKIPRGYKMLKELNLIYRIKQQTYLINPNILLLHPDYSEKVLKFWDLCKKEEKLKEQSE